MTVELAEPEKITALGNGVAFDFSFSPMVIYASSNLEVTHVDAAGVETLLAEGIGAANYSVTVSQYPGTGYVTYPADKVVALPAGEKIVVKPVLPMEQQTNLENQGGYHPDVQEVQFDKLLKISKQQQEELDRAPKITIGDTTTTLAALTADIQNLASIQANVTTVAGISANVTTVAGISANVTTVAGISANVTTVAGISANVTTVAGDSADVATVAGISADVATVAGISADVATVAGISTDVSAVASAYVGWSFSTTVAMADPGAGILRFNNADPALTTAIAVDDLDANAADVSAYVISWDDGTSVNKGTLVVRQGASFAIYTITALTDNAGWSELAVTYITGAGSFADATLSFAGFSRTGDKGTGDVVGPAGATKYSLAMFADTTGKALQDGPALGNAGDVMTSNGAGALPSMQAASGGAWQLISTTNISGAPTTLDFTSLTSVYSKYKFILEGVSVLTGGYTVFMLLSADGGTTWLAGTNYIFALDKLVNNVALDTFDGRGSTGSATILLIDGQMPDLELPALDGEITLSGFGVATDRTAFITELMVKGDRAAGGSYGRLVRNGGWCSTTGINAVQFLTDAGGNFASGIIKLYGAA